MTIRLRRARQADERIRNEVFKASNGLLEYVQRLMTSKTAVSAPVREEDKGRTCRARS